MSEHLVHIVEELKGKVLDIGAGECWLKERGMDYHAVDIDPQFCFVRKLNVSHQKLPYSAGFFDTVVMCELLEHLENPTFALKEARRVLKPDGFLVGTVPNIQTLKRVLWAQLRNPVTSERVKTVSSVDWEHLQVYGSLELNNVLHYCGFKPVFINLIVGFPLMQRFLMFKAATA